MRKLNDAACERRQSVCKTVVAVHPGDLFDEVDFALEIQPPGWKLHGVRTVSAGYERAAERGKDACDFVGCYRCTIDRGAEMTADFADSQRDGLAQRGAGFHF